MELEFNHYLRGARNFSDIAPAATQKAQENDVLVLEQPADNKTSLKDSQFRMMAESMRHAAEKWTNQSANRASENRDNLASAMINRHGLEKAAKNLPETILALPEDIDEKGALSPEMQANAKAMLADLEMDVDVAGYIATAGVYDTASSREICAELAKAIGIMSESYLDVFQQAVEKNAAFYQDFSDFMSKLKNFIEASDDKTILKANAFRSELQALINKYPVPGEASTLFPVQNGGTLKGASQDECIAWAKEMGLNPDNCVTRLSSGAYVVHIDVSPLQKIKDSVPAQDKMECNSAQWAAWQAGVDMQKDTIQTGMQTLTQKYSNANSTFDNLIKILSSTISSLLECDKAFFNI